MSAAPLNLSVTVADQCLVRDLSLISKWPVGDLSVPVHGQSVTCPYPVSDLSGPLSVTCQWPITTCHACRDLPEPVNGISGLYQWPVSGLSRSASGLSGPVSGLSVAWQDLSVACRGLAVACVRSVLLTVARFSRSFGLSGPVSGLSVAFQDLSVACQDLAVACQ